MQLSSSQDLEFETHKNKTTSNIFCPSDNLIYGRVLMSKQDVMVSYKLISKKKDREEKERRKNPKPGQGLGFKTVIAFSSVTTRRSCHGNHCKRLNIPKVHDCEKCWGRELH